MCIFLCGLFLKSSLNLLHYCFCFMFGVLVPRGMGSELPTQGLNPMIPALEVLTTGPPGKPLRVNYKGYSVSPAPAICFLCFTY